MRIRSICLTEISACSDFGIDGDQNDVCYRFEIIEHAIPSTFSFRNITITNADFEDSITTPANLIAKRLACLELLDDRVVVGSGLIRTDRVQECQILI